MQTHRCAVFRRGNHRNLEFAWQIAEFRVKCAPLTQQLGPWARIRNFVCGSPCILVGRNVANAVTAGLDGVHLYARQLFQKIAAFLQLDPVILDILPRGEMAIIAVIFARDMRQHPHLTAVQCAIGNGHAQHIGVQLQIQAIHQPQRLKLVLGHFARQAALHLIAKIGNARIDNGLVIIIIFIHVRLPASNYPGTDAGVGRFKGKV